MERPFERKSSDNEARISRRRKETSSARDLIVEAYQDLGGVPHPIGVPPRERKSPTQSGEFKRAKNIHPGEEIEEIPPENLEEVPDEAAAEAALEMGDGDTVPTREIMPWASTLPNEKSRQQKRAEIRQGEKRVSKVEKKSKSVFDIEDKATASAPVKKPRGFYPAGSLAAVMDRMDAIEIDLTQTRKEHNENLKGTEEKLLRELESLRKSLTVKNEGAIQTPPEVNDELPDLNLQYDGTLSVRDEDEPEMSWSEAVIDNPDAITTATKTNRPKKKTEQSVSLEGQALLESIADKYGIILSPEARAERLRELNETLEGFAPQLTEEARLNQLLADDEETLRTTEDITASNEEGLKGRIKDTKKKLASISKEVGDARDERDTLVEYPTAAEEVEFNMTETIKEITRTNPKNAIRLRQLHNTFADLEQMKGLLAIEKSLKESPAPSTRESPGTSREELAERLGIILDPREREANVVAIQNEIRDIGKTFVKIDEEIEAIEDKIAKTRIFKVQDRLEKEIEPLKERREEVKNRYDNAKDRYNEAAIFPTAQEELEAHLQTLRVVQENDPKDRASIEEQISDLERLKTLLPPPLPQKERRPDAQIKDLSLDYSYNPKTEGDDTGPELSLGEEVNVEIDTHDLSDEPRQPTESKTKAISREYDGYPTSAHSPRRRAEEKIAAIKQMVETRRTPSGRHLGTNEVLKFERAAAALERELPPQRRKQKTEIVGKVDERIEEMYQTQQRNASEQKQRNVAAYEERANAYKKELKDVAKKLALYGEYVEIPGEEAAIPEQTTSSWLGSFWKKVTNRGEIANLKQQYETALEQYEEAQQQKNAVKRNIPVYERATITRGPQGYAEEPGRIEQRRAELGVFEDRLKRLAETERSAQDLMDSLVLNQWSDGTPLKKEEKLKETDKIEKALLEQQTGDREYNNITRRRLNDIPIIQLDKLAIREEFNQYFEFDDETSEEIFTIQKDTEKNLKTLEARIAMGLGRTKSERDADRIRLNELKKLLGGKSAEEMAERASFMVRAAERVGLMEIGDPNLHQELAIKYGKRVSELKALLAPKGSSAELLTDLENELKQVVQETKAKF